MATTELKRGLESLNSVSVPLDFFRADPFSRDTAAQSKAFYRQFFGPEGEQLSRALRNGLVRFGTEDMYPMLDAPNAYFLESVRCMFELGPEQGPFSFYKNQMKVVLGVKNRTVGRLAPDLSEAFGLKNEVATALHNPARLMALSRMPVPQVDLRTKYEATTALSCGLIAGTLEARNHNNQLEEEFARIQDLFNATFYRGAPIGGGERHTFRYYFDNETNTVLGREEGFTTPPPGSHIKQKTLTLRYVPELDIWVYTHVRFKDQESALAKCLRKAELGAIEESKRTGTEVKPVASPLKDVKDFMGIKCVVMGGPRELERFVLSAKDVLGKHNRELKAIVPDNGVNGYSYQVNPDFLRYQLEYDGLKLPVELQFMDEKAYINSETQVIKILPNGEKKIGGAHRLYTLDRDESVFYILHPEQIYSDKEINYEDVRRSINHQRLRIVDELRNGRIA